MNTTIIYYSSNREKPDFEARIVEKLKEAAGDIPIISVTQKPMDLGKNICVGDVGLSYLNEYRQILIGCEAATTDFVFMAESDCLYPKGYFDFVPTKRNVIYKSDNHWILKVYRNQYFFKDHSQGNLVFDRLMLIEMIKEALKGLPQWGGKEYKFNIFRPEDKWEYFHIENPVINVKTYDGVCKNTYVDNTIEPVSSFEYWGRAVDLRRRLTDGKI